MTIGVHQCPLAISVLRLPCKLPLSAFATSAIRLTLSTINSQPSTVFWAALESVPGLIAFPTDWRKHVPDRPEFEIFSAIFLKPRPGPPADSVPCPWNCGCYHKVVPRENGTLAGICQCQRPDCGEYTVLPEERIQLELDWPKLGGALSHAFELDFKIAQLGLYQTVQIGTWSKDAIPAILTIPGSQREFLHTVTTLVAKLGKPFILFAPTKRHCPPAAQELLNTLGGAFFPLSHRVVFTGSQLSTPQLSTTQSSSTLFANVVPHVSEPLENNLAARVTTVLDDLDTGTASRRKHPSLATVFKLYYVEELPVSKVAKKCRCSAGTIVNRLKLIESKTGATPDQLRRVSPHFSKLSEDLSSAKSDFYRKRKYDL
jgi:hypothetical protein